MNVEVIIVGILFVALGTLMALYAHRFGRWFGGLGFQIFKVAPWLNITGKSREQAEHEFYDTWPFKGYWLFWLWGIRIIGAIMAVFSAFILILIIVQSIRG